MTRKEAERIFRQENALMSLGFTAEEAEQLRRISMTLRRWHELECGDGNGCIERDEETGKVYYRNARHSYLDPRDPRAAWRIADRETGAKKRLDKVVGERNKRAVAPGKSKTALGYYIQTDPRGAALYIIRPGDVHPGEDVSAHYNRGICVY